MIDFYTHDKQYWQLEENVSDYILKTNIFYYFSFKIFRSVQLKGISRLQSKQLKAVTACNHMLMGIGILLIPCNRNMMQEDKLDAEASLNLILIFI